MYLVGFGIGGGLGVFRLLDVFDHFPDEGVAVVLILGHDDLQHKPQSPDKEERLDISTAKTVAAEKQTGGDGLYYSFMTFVISNQDFVFHYLLFNFFELLDVLYFDVVWVVGQQVDGVGHHVLRQQREQLVCGAHKVNIKNLYLITTVLRLEYSYPSLFVTVKSVRLLFVTQSCNRWCGPPRRALISSLT